MCWYEDEDRLHNIVIPIAGFLMFYHIALRIGHSVSHCQIGSHNWPHNDAELLWVVAGLTIPITVYARVALQRLLKKRQPRQDAAPRPD